MEEMFRLKTGETFTLKDDKITITYLSPAIAKATFEHFHKGFIKAKQFD